MCDGWADYSMWVSSRSCEMSKGSMTDTSVKSEAGRPVIVWFRRDLRLGDNPALAGALASGRPVIALYVLDETSGLRAPGAASLWWLDKSLRRLAASIDKFGSRLILRRGPAWPIIEEVARQTGAARVVWNRLYDPGVTDRDAGLKAALKDSGAAPCSDAATTLSIAPAVARRFEIEDLAGHPVCAVGDFSDITNPPRTAAGEIRLWIAEDGRSLLIRTGVAGGSATTVQM